MTQTSAASAQLPTYSYTQIADHMVNAYWEAEGGAWHAFMPDDGRTVTVNLAGLTNEGRNLALAALDTWESVSPLVFDVTLGTADITFDDNAPGAVTNFVFSGNQILSADINISTQWLSFNGTGFESYSMQTYLHEIGHALGLGHAGFYDGSGTYGTDNHYANDSWQATLMSYFDQEENFAVDADYALALTPMAADLIAIDMLYGPSNTNMGATVYGAGSNVGGYLGDLFSEYFDPSAFQTPGFAFTVKDTGGKDTINLVYEYADQLIDLTPGAASDIAGLVGNMLIAEDTTIEIAIGGSGKDDIVGNEAANRLSGNGDGDMIIGMARADFIDGGSGADILSGNGGPDKIKGRGGRDKLFGGAGDDTLAGNAGDDTLVGGGGADQFDFNAGSDIIRDFTDNTDILALEDGLWQGVLTAEQVIGQFAEEAINGVSFAFDNGATLLLEGIAQASLLEDDLIFI